MKKIIKFSVFPFIFIFDWLQFLVSKKSTKYGYASFRYLFVISNGRMNDFLTRIISKTKPKYTFTLSEEEHSIVNQIKKNGYCCLERTLDPTTILKLTEIANSTPSRFVDTTKKGIEYSDEKVVINHDAIISPRYQFDTNDLLKHSEINDIITDEFYLRIANEYLNTKPILDIVTSWWSFPFGNKGTSQAAQMYHFDMDRIKFIKFFFYLTDVTTSTGPHCYIEGSHTRLAKNTLKDGRYSDEELLNHFDASDFKELSGKKGSIIAVDTRGFHKGKPLETDKRLLFQIQFSNSLYGAPYSSYSTDNLDDSTKAKVEKHRRTFQLFK